MKKEIIQAFSGSGDERSMVGEDNIDIPETLAEAIQLAGGEDKVLNAYVRQLKTDAKNRLRAVPTGGKKAEEIYNKCIAAGLEDAKAREISGFTG